MNYNREKIRAEPIRIKEWDCYVILNPDFGLSLIVADVGYFGMATVDWRDFKNNKSQGDLALKFDGPGKMNLPRTADIGDVFFKEKKRWIKFERNKNTIPNRFLTFDFPKFKYEGHKGISGEIKLYQDPKLDTMVNVIPFRNPKHFVYVQKICCMPANGTVNVGGKTYEFQGEKNNSWCALDWSRGVFPVKTEWWWAFASGIVNGVHFGMNIDYGFGKKPSSKNMLFYDGKGHHLDEVTYTWDDKDLMKPWQFTSNDGRVELQLVPVHEHRLKMNVMLMYQEGTHVFGYYKGDVVLDDGTKIHIDRSDKLFGSAEYYDHGW